MFIINIKAHFHINGESTIFSKGWNVISLRYFNPIGAHKSGNIGEDPQVRSYRMFSLSRFAL
jgi:UDP-glucose 4-epimerase